MPKKKEYLCTHIYEGICGGCREIRGYNEAIDLCTAHLAGKAEGIEEILANIKLPWKDFCPCDYTEQKGEGILVIKRRIGEVIAQAIKDYLLKVK